MNTYSKSYDERLHEFIIDNFSKWRPRKLDIYSVWAFEMIRFKVEYCTDKASLKPYVEGMTMPITELVATSGDKKQKKLLIKTTWGLLKIYPESERLKEAVEILSFNDTKGKPGRKRLGISERDLSCIGDLYELRKEQGCFNLPDNGEDILNAGLEASVKAIEHKDRKTNVEDWITELSLTKPLPLCPERLAKLYTKQRPRLIVRDLIDILAFGH